MKKYETYKNSGVEWLGEIPEHWEVKRFKHISDIQKGKLPKKIISTNEFNLPPYMSMEYLRGGEENQWVFDKDAKVINENKTLLLWDGSNAGEFIKSRKGVISSTVAEIEFKNINSEFAWFYSKFLEIELRKKTIGMGIPHVNGTELKNFSVAIPPIEEQTAIAHFLDDKTTKIDQAIAIKQKQIELLKERRQILIHKAVTRGLDDRVKLKDSGVEWIGEIPEHWEVKKLGYLTYKIGDGLHGTPNYTDGTGFYFINGNNLSTGNIEITQQTKTVSEREYLIHKKELTDKTLLLSINGTIGNVAFYCGEKVMLGKSAAYLNFYKNINIDYIKCFLESTVFKNYYELQLSGSTINNFSLYSIGKTPITFPNKIEQQQIVQFIKEGATKIATAISLKEQEIEKLKEYKMSLIDGVVTGKVKVC